MSSCSPSGTQFGNIWKANSSAQNSNARILLPHAIYGHVAASNGDIIYTAEDQRHIQRVSSKGGATRHILDTDASPYAVFYDEFSVCSFDPYEAPVAMWRLCDNGFHAHSICTW
jgi:hypothetical protein